MSLQSILSFLALMIALFHVLTGRVPLWLAVILLALAVLLPSWTLR
ncbi:hypothetical protein [Vitiosangium sp. GDMCC 1.1324]|nr:hypothetical protein [Vitiosangium sp. GDMCC 1.1324]